MTWPLAVAGTVHRDDIATPHGRATSLGGSALYFALAASRFVPVSLNAIVGTDCAGELREVVRECRIDLDGLAVSRSRTFVWHAVHDFERWITASETAEEGCDPEWNAELSEQSAAAPALFLASMRPSLQETVLHASGARMIGVDTMTVYTEAQQQRVRAVARRATLLFLNHAELASLTGVRGDVAAARSLLGTRTRAVIVKRGPRGAALVMGNSVVERAAHPVDRVIDPTGAGDALAGGFMGFCCAAERDDPDVYDNALSAGLECAAQAIASFGTTALRSAIIGP